jgi:outer membrane protein assembly factor BamE (lipoprotein component of BamABCDE complex)
MKASLKWTLRILAVAAFAAVALTAAALWWSSRDTTVYAPGFNEEAFQRLKPGMELAEVYSLLGEPLAVRQEDSPERWCYGEAPMVRKGSTFVVQSFFRTPRCVSFSEAGVVLTVSGEGMAAIQEGMTAEEVLQLLGEPDRRGPAASRTLHYTSPGGEGLFRARIVAVDTSNRVSKVISYQFYD